MRSKPAVGDDRERGNPMRLQCTFKEESSLEIIAKVTMQRLHIFAGRAKRRYLEDLYIQFTERPDDNFRPNFLAVRDAMTSR